jgi:hypothetical protein
MKKFLIGVLVWSFVIAACVVLSACASAPEVAGGYGCTQAKTLSNGFDPLRGVGVRAVEGPDRRLQQAEGDLIPDHRAFTECPLAWHFPGNN